MNRPTVITLCSRGTQRAPAALAPPRLKPTSRSQDAGSGPALVHSASCLLAFRLLTRREGERRAGRPTISFGSSTASPDAAPKGLSTVGHARIVGHSFTVRHGGSGDTFRRFWRNMSAESVTFISVEVPVTPTSSGKATDFRAEPVLPDQPKGRLTEIGGRPHAQAPAASLIAARVR